MGETWSAPAIGQVQSDTGPWVVVAGSGFLKYSVQTAHRSGVARAGTTFYVLDVATGDVLGTPRDVGADSFAETVDDCRAADDCRRMKNALQMDPVATGVADQRFLSKVYIGDLDGKVWRFSLDSPGSGLVNVSTPTMLYDAGSLYPLFASMATVNVGGSNQYLFLGTGSDLLPSNNVNYSYSLLVLLDNGASASKTSEILLERTDWPFNTGGDEKVTAFPAVAGDIVFFTTTTHSPTTPCTPFSANLYAFTFIGGPAYDTNNDGQLSTGSTGGGGGKGKGGGGGAAGRQHQGVLGGGRQGDGPLRRRSASRVLGRRQDRAVRRPGRFQQRRRPGRCAAALLARREVSAMPAACTRCGQRLRSTWTRCPRCREERPAGSKVEPVPLRLRRRHVVVGAVAAAGILLIAGFALQPRHVPAGIRTERQETDHLRLPLEHSVESAPVAADPRPAAIHDTLDSIRAGNAAYAQGEVDAAFARYTAAVAASPGHAEARNNLAQVLVRRGDPAAALPHLDVAVRLEPGRWSYRFNRARTYSALKRWSDAAAEYEAAARLFPDDYATLYNLGLAQISLRRFSDAVGTLERAIELAPAEPALWPALGTAYVGAAQPDRARAVFQRFLEVSPASPEAPRVARLIEALTADTSGQ